MFEGKVVCVKHLFPIGPFFYGPIQGLSLAEKLLVYDVCSHWSFLSPILSLVFEWMRIPFVLLVVALAEWRGVLWF